MEIYRVALCSQYTHPHILIYALCNSRGAIKMPHAYSYSINRRICVAYLIVRIVRCPLTMIKDKGQCDSRSIIYVTVKDRARARVVVGEHALGVL